MDGEWVVVLRTGRGEGRVGMRVPQEGAFEERGRGGRSAGGGVKGVESKAEGRIFWTRNRHKSHEFVQL